MKDYRMQIHSINVGEERPINAKSGKSGIYKLPTTAPVYVGELGLKGDVIIDTENHGGVDQAVYVYGVPDYDWWSRELDTTLTAGTFGENITITELESASMCIGDRLEMGGIILEVTSPRIPCVTLATRMNDPKFVKRFVEAERYGAYCRVLQSGDIQAGQPITYKKYDWVRVTIVEVAEAFYSKSLTAEQIQRFQSVPLHEEAKGFYASKLT